MRVTGSATLAAPPERVFDALRDPDVLLHAIPGCEHLEAIAPDTYRMTVSAGVAAVKGTYQGRVALSEPQPPSSFTLRAQGKGAPGTVDATVRIRLTGEGPRTRVDYDADAIVGGMVGGVGQRMLAGVAKKTAGEFFAAVGRQLTAPDVAHVPPQAAPTAAVSSRTGIPQPAPAAPAETSVEPVPAGTASPHAAPPGIRSRDATRLLITGAVLGSAAALAGALVGAAITRAALPQTSSGGTPNAMWGRRDGGS